MGAKVSSALFVGLCAAFLSLSSGCGAYNASGTGTGGGGSVPGQAQGFYMCQLGLGPSMAVLITPTDQFFGILGTSSVSSFVVTGLASGQGASGNNTYSGTFTAFSSGAAFTDVVAATDVPGSSISGTFTDDGVQTGFAGVPLPTTSYDFGTAASVSQIAGAWSGFLIDQTAVSINIGTTGIVSPVSASGCQVSGSVAADTSNRNFYDVKLAFDQSSCATSIVAGQRLNGIGLFYLQSDGVTQQMLLAVSEGTTAGTVFSAQK